MAFEIRHGDCREVMATLADQSIEVIITDPPYGIGFKYASYDDSRENLRALIADVYPEMCRVAKRVIVLCGPTQIQMWPEANWVGAVVWKTTGSFGRCGFNQWTPFLIYGKDVAGIGSHNGILKSDVLTIGGVSVFRRDEHEKKHPCPKSIAIMQPLVRRFCEVGDTILDPFTGSGSTGKAALLEGFRFLGIEREAEYVEIARARCAAAQQPKDLFNA